MIIEHDSVTVHRGLLGRERQTMMFHLDEARTLRAFWKLLRGFNPKRDLVVGHNLFDFDLPFLYKRSIVQRVRPSVELSFARYRSQPIFDTMHEWNKWSPRKFVDATLNECILTHEGRQTLRLDRPSSTSNRVVTKKPSER